jgi:site-specific recombinase XerD
MHDVVHHMRATMERRGFRPNTVVTYLQVVRKFLGWLDKPVAQVTRSDVERYLLKLAREKRSPRTRNVALTALRQLFTDVLQAPDVTTGIRRARVAPTVPTILSGSEVQAVLDHLASPTHRALIATLYGCGLRVSEVCSLRIDHVDTKRMRLRICDAKNGDRYARLTPAVLEALRAHYRARHPPGPWLFPGRPSTRPLNRVSVSKVLCRAATELGLNKRVYPHALRHSFAVHLLDLGADLRVVQVLLGHRRVTSTTQYLYLSQERLARAPSPLDALGTAQATRLG